MRGRGPAVGVVAAPTAGPLAAASTRRDRDSNLPNGTLDDSSRLVLTRHSFRHSRGGEASRPSAPGRSPLGEALRLESVCGSVPLRGREGPKPRMVGPWVRARARSREVAPRPPTRAAPSETSYVSSNRDLHVIGPLTRPRFLGEGLRPMADHPPAGAATLALLSRLVDLVVDDPSVDRAHVEARRRASE